MEYGMMNKMFYFLTQGIGRGQTPLTSFDSSLLSSGIANYNLVKISSILPAGSVECDGVSLKEGSILHTAYALLTSNQEGAIISAAVGVAIPQDPDKVGVIMEYSAYCSKQEAINQISLMLQEAMDNRGYLIREIKSVANEVIVPKDGYVTAFAALSIW